MPYKIIDDATAKRSSLVPHITLQGETIQEYASLDEAKAALKAYTAQGREVSAFGFELPTVNIQGED